MEKTQSPFLGEYKSYFIRISILTVVSSILVTLFTTDQGSIYGRYLIVLVVFVPAILLGGFILGLFVALIPYKNLPYSRKYFQASLKTIFWMLVCLTIAAATTLIFLMINHS